MARGFSDINRPGSSFGTKKEEPQETKLITGVDDPQPVEDEQKEPEVRLISAEWKPGPKGFQYLEQCFLDVQTEFLPGKEKTVRLRIRGDLFGVYNGQEFDLSQEVVGYIDRKTGIARLEIKRLWFIDDHHPQWEKDPKTPCMYKIKGIFHSLGENQIDSPELQMPAGTTLYKIEIEDVLFNHNSAVLLPEQPESASSEQGAPGTSGLVISHLQSRATGLQGIRAILKYIQEDPGRSILLVGHTDTSGEVGYNFQLSEKRANSVLHLLCGEADEWAHLCSGQHNVEDYQQILKHFAGLLLWSCDPGQVDNIIGPKTKSAVETFQRLYNAHREHMHLGDADIPIQAPSGNDLNVETWKAFFRLYQWELSIIVAGSENQDDLQPLRDSITFVDPDVRSVGCGESFPVDAQNRDSFKSQRNRRVEVLFFDAGEAPDSVAPPPQGSQVYTTEDYPLYDETKFRSNYVKVYEPQYMVYLDIQTVDSLGFPVANAEIRVSSDNGDVEEPYSVAVTTDDSAFVRVYAVPVGKIAIEDKDGEMLTFRSEGKEEEAVFEARGVQNGILRVVVEHVSHEELHSYDRQIEKYSTFNATSGPAKPSSPRTNRVLEHFGIDRDKYGNLLSVDNLLMCAGFDSEGTPNLKLFASDVLNGWRKCYCPSLNANGYLVHCISKHDDGFHLRIYDSEGTHLDTFNLVTDIHALQGVYALFCSVDGSTFLDVTNRRFGILDDTRTPFVIEDVIHPSQLHRFNELKCTHSAKLTIYCYYRSEYEYFFNGLLGGTGCLEPYSKKDQAISDSVHARNIAAVESHCTCYKSYVHNYIAKVEQCKNEDSLRQLGPPIRGYAFPIPVNASSQQTHDILSANTTGKDELDAWMAISRKIDAFIGRRATGLFFVAKINYSQDINKFQKVQVEYNFTYDSDGKVLQKVDKKLLTGYSGEIDLSKYKKLPSKKSFDAGVEHELDLETGEGKLKGSLKVGAYGIEFANDGCMKVTKQLHDRVALVGETKPNEMTMGFGTEITLNKDDPNKADGSSKLFLGVSAQGLRPDTVMAFVSNAPGFFDRRPLSDLLSRNTQWNDLTYREQLKLEGLGFSMDFWDDKHTHSLRDYPESARKQYHELAPREQVAVVHLGFNSTTWPAEIKKAAAK